eukprot:PRCOL_00005824-RA
MVCRLPAADLVCCHGSARNARVVAQEGRVEGEGEAGAGHTSRAARVRCRGCARAPDRGAGRDMDWSCKAMLQETLRCLQKTEVDLAVDAEAVKHHVSMAIAEFDRLPGRCTRCWGKGVMKVRCREAVGALCLLCGGQGEMMLPEPQACSRCKGCCIEQCTDCAGYGIS